jgi:hypothetical protein
VQRRLILEQLDHLLVERRDRVGLVEGETLARGLRAVAKPVPDLALLVALAAEQDAAALRGEHEHCLRLGEAAEVIEVAVEAVGEMRVAVAQALGGGRHERHALADGLRQAPPALDMVRNGVVRFQRSVLREARWPSSSASRSRVPTSCHMPR